MTPPNEGAEPAKVATEVAGQVPATEPAPAEPPPPVSAEDLQKELAPKPETPPPAEDPQVTSDRNTRAAKFNLQITTNLKSVEKAVAEGKTLDEALEGVPQHLQGKIRKVAEGEPIDEKKQTDPAAIAAEVAGQTIALNDANRTLLAAIESNGLNIATADAKASRDSLIADFHRLLQGNSPAESAKYAMLNAGIVNKASEAAAYQSGVNDANKGVPPPGQPGTSPAGTPPPGQEPSEEDIKTMDFDKLRGIDQVATKKAAAAAPLIVPNSGQGNPNVV